MVDLPEPDRPVNHNTAGCCPLSAACASRPTSSADQFQATVVWMSDEALKPGRGYWL